MPGPPVALLHGFATTFDSTWRHNGWVDLLHEAGREVVEIDLLGHGRAPKPHEPEAYAELEQRVLDELPADPVDIIGFSMGARTTLICAATAPERFRKIVVAGVGANLFAHATDRGTRIRDAVLGNADPEDREAYYFSQLAAADGMDRQALAACISRTGGPKFSAEFLAPVTHPVLVCLGDRDFAGPADPLLDALPNATLKVLRGVDHFATPKDFGFLDAALGFLDAFPR
jgi:pimeloyl-ACP methyl ester carboxylesterase